MVFTKLKSTVISLEKVWWGIRLKAYIYFDTPQGKEVGVDYIYYQILPCLEVDKKFIKK